MVLFARRRLGFHAQQSEHVRPDGVELLIELIAQGIHASKAIVDGFAVA